eukprot:CAMPEP_0185593434 /NCGR_PEP_ID=MMETSP0434-20130131/71439_1 /TAXON_ID=626734 ORGANISM="Favella taraikaensis, Strain Fe Narragansett Bay" /NCGR_SAMPLE_ID=MMETSP0434 /ASSEMBLY_ACC=CAM_ASM_000379 /LENGTH=38 /DNA_ID= /DNA_START= /DNA_END= /DNA_ORIENTATION=
MLRELTNEFFIKGQLAHQMMLTICLFVMRGGVTLFSAV